MIKYVLKMQQIIFGAGNFFAPTKFRSFFKSLCIFLMIILTLNTKGEGSQREC